MPRHATPRHTHVDRLGSPATSTTKISLLRFTAHIVFYAMWATCFGVSVMGTHDAEAHRAWEVGAPSFYVQEFLLNTNQQIVFETDSEPGVDEVMHLMVYDVDPSIPGSPTVWRQVAFNDNYSSNTPPNLIRCGGNFSTTSRIQYRNNRGQKKFLLIVRSKGIFTVGNARLCVDGQLVTVANSFEPEPIPVGGFVFPQTFLTITPLQDPKKLLAIPTPDGSTWPVTMAFTDSENEMIGRFGWDGGAGGGTVLSLTADLQPLSYFIGTPTYKQTNGVVIKSRSGNARLYVNDLPDADADGVGDRLEQALKQCWSPNLAPYTSVPGPIPNHASCVYTATPEDSDRDGLPDGEELFGYLGEKHNTRDDVAFPRWGSNPRHKDIFVAIAWQIGAHIGLLHGSNLNKIRSAYAQAPASHVHNPDGRDGIEVHFDLNKETTDDFNFIPEHISGILSSQITRVIIPAFYIGIDGPVNEEFYIKINGTLSPAINGAGQTTKALALSIIELMENWLEGDLNTPPEPVRVTQIQCGDFIYSNKIDFITYCPEDAKINIRIDTLIEEQNFTGEINDLEGNILVHSDFTETKNIKKLTDADFYPNHVFDEKYIPQELARRVRDGVFIVKGGQAQNSGFIAADSEIFAHELGHTIGLLHSGHSHWPLYNIYMEGGIDAIEATLATQGDPIKGNNYNCSPHYSSIMNYLWEDELDVGFSRSENMISLNSSNIREDNFYTDGLNEQDFYLSTFNSNPPSVDWNRNRQLDQNLAYNVSLRFGLNNCAPFTNGAQLIEQGNFSGTNDIIRTKSNNGLEKEFIYAFYQNKNNDLIYSFAPMGEATNSSCTGPDNPTHYPSFEDKNGGCLNWNDLPQPINRNATNVSAYWWEQKVFVAHTTTNNRMIVSLYTVRNNGILNLINQFNFNEETHGKAELSLIYLHQNGIPQERLTLVYNDPLSTEYKAYFWNGSNFEEWDTFSNARYRDGISDQLTGKGNPSLVSWPDPFNTIAKEDEKKDFKKTRITCGVFPTTQNALKAYCFDPFDHYWREFSETVFPQNVKGTDPVSTICKPYEVFEWTQPTINQGTCLPVTTSPPEISIRYIRYASGLPVSLANIDSHFQLSFRPPFAETEKAGTIEIIENNAPFIWLSEPLNMLNRHPLNNFWAFNLWKGHFIDKWSFIEAGTNISMYDDSTMGGTFAIGVLQAEGGKRPEALRFYPNADGSDNFDIWIGSDFRVMEDYVCAGLNRQIDGTIKKLESIVSCGTIDIFQ